MKRAGNSGDNNGTACEEAKKTKTESTAGPVLTSLKGAHSVKVLNENINDKVSFFHVKMPQMDGEDDDAVVILEKKPFYADDGSADDIFTEATSLTLEMKNDAYGTYTARLPERHCLAKATVIHPATKKHILKYTRESHRIVLETDRDYETITKPMLDRNIEDKVFNLKWVHNILDGVAERERVLHEDADHVLVMDYKWDGRDPSSLNCLAMPKRRDLRSIRDLTGEHLDLLEKMKSTALRVFKEKFEIDEECVKSYFHYQPSFYHLHVHFSNVKAEANNSGQSAWRAHLLDDVIGNIKLASDYYQKKTLVFALRDSDPLNLEFKKHRKN